MSMSYEYGRADTKGDKSSLKIGIVSIKKIFKDCKSSAKHREEGMAMRGKFEAELEQLSAQIEADRAALRTRKPDSNDYQDLLKGVLTKQGTLQAQQKFYEQQLAMKEQGAVEEIYKDILRVTAEVAKQKGLDLVFEMSEPEFPSAGTNELTLTMSTHKLLYSAGCLDITNDVMAKIDAAE